MKIPKFRWLLGKAANKVCLALFASLLTLATAVPTTYGVVLIRDGFGDGDVNNNGVAFGDDDVVGTYEPFFDEVEMTRDGSPLLYPVGTMVNGPTVADDSSDTGIRWLTTGGFGTSGSGAAASSPRIIDDTAGVLPETNPAIGFVNNIPAGNPTQFSQALDSGLALSVEAKGRGRTMSGFFERDAALYSDGKQGTVELGPNVDDEIKVSFDFRVWMSAPNFNSSSGPNGAINHVPDYGHLRFGLFQDTDNELGQTNDFAGSGFTPAVWGEENGLFRGDNISPDASGDAGYHVRIPIQDAASSAPAFAIGENGQDARIVEETNDTGIIGERIMEGGDNDTVASPDQLAPDFVNLENTKRYNISLSLKRFDEATGSTDPNDPGDNIEATLEIYDIDDPVSSRWTLSGSDGLDDLVGPGFESDSWDYFSMGVFTAGVDAQDFDFIMDNFTVECFGSNCGSPVDADGDGDVDGADFLQLQRESPSLISDWQAAYPGGLPALSAVPEPTSIVMLSVVGLAVIGMRRRN